MINKRTHFSFLDPAQRRAFRNSRAIIHRMADKWDDSLPGDEADVFVGKKTLEQEIENLENLSLAAYRTMKLLRKQLTEGSRDEDYCG